MKPAVGFTLPSAGVTPAPGIKKIEDAGLRPCRKFGEKELPLPLLATESPAAHRERSSDDIYVGRRVRAQTSSWMRAPSPAASGLTSTSPLAFKDSHTAGYARPDLLVHLQLHPRRQSILEYPRCERGRRELPEHWTQQ